MLLAQMKTRIRAPPRGGRVCVCARFARGVVRQGSVCLSAVTDGWVNQRRACLMMKIEEFTAANARLNAEIQNLESEEALDEAAAARERQSAE